MGLLKNIARNLLPGFVAMKLDPPKPATPLPEAQGGNNRDLAAEIPFSRFLLAGGLADYADDVYDLDPQGYAIIRRCPPIVAAVRKAGQRVCKLDWQVKGGNPARAAAFKEIFEQAIGWPGYFTWQTWALFEGYRVMQIKEAQAKEGRWTVPDWRLGGRRKWKAGPTDGKGTVHFDGETLASVQEVTALEIKKSEALPRDEFVIFRPGAGSNPEGDFELPLIAYDIAKDWKNGRLNASKYVEIYGVPMRGYEKNIEKMRPGAVEGVLEAARDKVQQLKTGSVIALPSGDKLTLFEPQGHALADLWGHMRELAGIVWQLILFTKLTQDTADAGPTGSSSVGLSEEDAAMLVLGMEHAEALNTDFVPWADARNELPPLGEDEHECYFWPEPPKSADAMNVGGKEEHAPVAGEDPNDATGVQQKLAEQQQRMFAQRLNHGDHALVSLAAISAMPPVHP